MKPILCAISAALMLAITSTPVLAYSGSECEVNDCSKPSSTKANSNTPKGQVKTKAELKNEAKEEAKTQAKNKAMDKTPAPLRDVAGFFK
ncbi:MAG: hypothetical protein WCL27_05695 [Betaproteobacteria bacterium]